MRRIDFNSKQIIDIPMLCLLCSSLLLLVWSFYCVMINYHSINLTQQEVERRQRASTSQQVVSNYDNPVEQAAVSEIHKQIRYPWEQLFSTLEQTHVEYVSLMTFKPNIADKELLILAQSDSVQQIFEYVKAIQNHENVAQVELQSQQHLEENADRRLNFGVVIRFK